MPPKTVKTRNNLSITTVARVCEDDSAVQSLLLLQGGRNQVLSVDHASERLCKIGGRKHYVSWTAARVLALLREVMADPPFLKGYKQKGAAWETIADTLRATKEFADADALDAIGCRNKYTQLMKNHRSDAASAPFRSGSSEEYTEACALLDDLSDLELDLQNIQEIDAEKTREDEERTRVASDVVEIASNTTLEKTLKRTPSRIKQEHDENSPPSEENKQKKRAKASLDEVLCEYLIARTESRRSRGDGPQQNLETFMATIAENFQRLAEKVDRLAAEKDI